MKPNFKLLGSTASLAILILSFQNCSPVNFGSNQAQAAKSGIVVPDDGLAADIPDDDMSNDDMNDDDSDEVADHDHNHDGNDDHDKKDCPNKGPGNVKDRESADKYRAICKEDRKHGFVSLSADASIIGSNGSIRFKAPSIKEVSGNNGAVVAKHDGTGAGTIKRLASNNGATVICGFDVEDIASLNGAIVIVGGHVDKISASNGAITLVDSSLGSAVGNNGAIRVKELK